MEYPSDTQKALAEIHDHYVAGVNEAIAQGDDDLVAELASRYIDEAAVLLWEGSVAA